MNHRDDQEHRTVWGRLMGFVLQDAACAWFGQWAETRCVCRDGRVLVGIPGSAHSV